jgi:hypothetical protein
MSKHVSGVPNNNLHMNAVCTIQTHYLFYYCFVMNLYLPIQLMLPFSS